MKKLLFLILAFVQSAFDAQTLTQGFNEPIVGDSDRTYPIDTSAFAGGLPISVTGSNSVWNFTNLSITNSVINTAYVNTVTVPSATAYPGSTLVQKQGTLYTFIKSVKTPTTQTEVLGVFSTSLSLTFTNSALAAKYPVNYGSTVSDNISGSFIFSTTPGTCSGNIITNADGLGTLNLPNGITLTNVLRVKSVQTLTLTAGFIPLGNIKQTIYNFYHSSQKFPMLSINYQSLSFIISPTPTVTAFVTGNAKTLIASISQNTQDSQEIIFYPNPLNSILHLRVNEIYKPKLINIYDELLQLIYTRAYTENINMYDYHKGIYIVEVQTEKGSIIRKIIKE